MRRLPLYVLVALAAPARAEEPVPASATVVESTESTESTEPPVPVESPPAPAAIPPIDDEPSAADVANAPLPGTETGRIDKPEGDSTLRDIGQGIMLFPRAAVELVLSPVRAGFYLYGRYRIPERAKRATFDDTETYGLYPVANIDTSYGLTFGGRFVHKNVFGQRENMSIRASTGGRFRGLFESTFKTGERLSKRVSVELLGEAERRPHDKFYGIGNADGSLLARHRQQHGRVATTIDVRTIGALHLRAAGQFIDLEYAPSDEGPPIDMIYDPSMLTGWTGVRNVYGELELRWDTRRHADRGVPNIPDSGWLLSGFGGRVHQLEAGNDYSRWGLDIQRFFRLAAGPRVLVARAHGEMVTGHLDDVAFTDLPQLGGPQLLRGYPLDRFRDRVAAIGSLEYQWDLADNIVASLFTDGGRVYRSLDDLETDGMRVGFGATLQLQSSRQFLASLIVASSIDGGIFLDLVFDPVFEVQPRVKRR